MADLDRRGIPCVMVASEQFRSAARAQADAPGFEPAIVWVPHPVQNRRREELRAIAADAIDEINAQLTRP